MTQRAQTITFGYSDSEDRLWARLILNPEQDVKFWITRRLLQRLIDRITHLLEQTTQASQPSASSSQVQQYLKTEFFEATRATRDPNPPPPVVHADSTIKNIPIEMCLEIKIQIHDSWRFIFSGSQQKHIVLPLERSLVPKFLMILLNQQKFAQWQIPHSAKWLIPSATT